MDNQLTNDAKATERKLLEWAHRWLGPRAVTGALVVFLVASATLDVLGKTTNFWSYLKLAFTEKTSLLNTAEMEVLDEWVVLIDSAETFIQAETYRQQLERATAKFSDKGAADHFARNLRVVRDTSTAGYWLLVADITAGRSSSAEAAANIDCVRRQVVSWEADDIVSPWFKNARPLDYSLSDFNRTYGRATNVPAPHNDPARKSEQPGIGVCPFPYAPKS